MPQAGKLNPLLVQPAASSLIAEKA